MSNNSYDAQLQNVNGLLDNFLTAILEHPKVESVSRPQVNMVKNKVGMLKQDVQSLRLLILDFKLNE